MRALRKAKRSIASPRRAITPSVRGQSLVELALTLPLLMVLMAGVVDLAHAFSVAGILANAAREGARYGETNPTDVDSIKNRVIEEAAGAPLTLIVGEGNVATDYT